MKRLQNRLFTHYLIAKQDGVKISELPNKPLKFGPITRSLLNIWCQYQSQCRQRTTRIMMVLSVWFLISYYVQNWNSWKCWLENSISFLEVFKGTILWSPLFFSALEDLFLANGKVCFKRGSYQSWLRMETFKDEPTRC